MKNFVKEKLEQLEKKEIELRTVLREEIKNRNLDYEKIKEIAEELIEMDKKWVVLNEISEEIDKENDLSF